MFKGRSEFELQFKLFNWCWLGGVRALATAPGDEMLVRAPGGVTLGKAAQRSSFKFVPVEVKSRYAPISISRPTGTAPV